MPPPYPQYPPTYGNAPLPNPGMPMPPPIMPSSPDMEPQSPRLNDAIRRSYDEAVRAESAATKAWDAASRAADAAQAINDSENYLQDLAEKAAIQAAEAVKEHAAQAAREAAAAALGEYGFPAKETKDDYIDFPEESKQLPEGSEIVLFSEEKDEEEKLTGAVALFKKLRALSEYLPEEKKKAFITAKIMEKLDHIISVLTKN